jgi:hypothetical protein
MRADVQRAGESLEDLKQRLGELEGQFAAEVATLQGKFDPTAAGIQKTQVRPRKSDIAIGTIGLCWTPWKGTAEGMIEPV